MKFRDLFKTQHAHDLNERVTCGQKHYTHDQQRAPECQQCRICGKFIRPDDAGAPCPDGGEACPCM